MIIDILKQAKEGSRLVGIRTVNMDSDETHVGFIRKISEVAIEISTVNQFGSSSGSLHIEMQSILSVDYNDRYLRRLQALTSHAIENTDTSYETFVSSKFKEQMERIKKASRVCTISFFEDCFVTGKIDGYDSDFIRLANIGIEGDEDGTSVYRIENIESISYDGMDERKIEFLYESRESFYKTSS